MGFTFYMIEVHYIYIFLSYHSLLWYILVNIDQDEKEINY